MHTPCKASALCHRHVIGHCFCMQTTIDVTEAPNGSCSLLKIVTNDRSGLLVDIVRVLKDINLNVVSAEVCAPPGTLVCSALRCTL